MADKNPKDKPNKKETLHLFTNKQNDLLFFTYQVNHPKRIDIEEFTLGKLRLYRRDKIYSAQLKSKPFLNPSLLWNAETFQLMMKKFDQYVIEEDNIDFSEWLFVCVYFRIKGKEINMLKIRVHQEFGIDSQAELWTDFRKYNIFKANHMTQAHKTINSLETQIQLVMNRLEKTQEEQIAKVQDVKKKLSALMYEKEKKIMELTGNHSYEWEPDQDSQQPRENKNDFLSIEPNQNNFMFSQEERFMGSLFAPSQDFMI